MAGIVYIDHSHRDSFAYDVMEPIRPYVDDWLLEFIKNHTFSKKEFYENKDGGVRLTLKLTPLLAATTPTWADKLVPVIDQVIALVRAENK